MNGFQKARVYLAAVFLGAASAGLYSSYLSSNNEADPVDEDLNQIMALIQTEYINKDKVADTVKMKARAISGMLNNLDPHSAYLDPEETKEMLAPQQEFVGIGVELNKEKDKIHLYPRPGSPAERAGVRDGDIVTHVDNVSTADMSLGDLAKKVRGEPGTNVTLRLERDGSAPVEANVKREIIVEPAITSRTIGKDIGYIQIETFNEDNMAPKLEQAVTQIRKSLGAGLKGYIIDLRSNGGGNLMESITISDSFLEKGTIVSVKGRTADESLIADAAPGDIAGGKPIVILVDPFSASASEVFAGAMQDHGRAIIMGLQTYGKGSVQTVRNLGPLGGIKYTTALYFTPSGRSIQGKGITPDIEVRSPKIDAALEAAKKAGMEREADLKDSIANPDPNAPAPTQSKAVCSPAPQAQQGTDDSTDRKGNRDEMLLCAIEELRGAPHLTIKIPAVPKPPVPGVT